MNPLMDSRQVADLLKCSERTVEDHARAGRLPAVKFGDGWMFPVESLLRAVNRMAEEEAAALWATLLSGLQEIFACRCQPRAKQSVVSAPTRAIAETLCR